MTESHVTKTNPTGEVTQCDRRDIHEAHEWQRDFGAYFDVYCPGNDGKSREGETPIPDSTTKTELLVQRWNPDFDFDLTYYLSGPMTGIEDYNYPAFEHAASTLRATGIKLYSPHEVPWPADESIKNDKQLLWQYMMRQCDIEMEKCQGIILLKGWPLSSGATRELMWARQYDYQSYWFYDNFTLTKMSL